MPIRLRAPKPPTTLRSFNTAQFPEAILVVQARQHATKGLRSVNARPVGERAKLELAIPVLAARDLTEAVRFYADTLGFEITWRWGDPPEMAAVRRDAVEIHLSADPHGEVPRSRVYCVVGDLDNLAGEYAARGAPFLHEVADQPHGMREFDLEDPSGNCICLGQPIP